jgi:tripartite ATP-independent transporter DctP family solute receptor
MITEHLLRFDLDTERRSPRRSNVLSKITNRLIGILIAAGAVILAGAPVEAQNYTLRFNHVLGPGEPYHKGFLTWAERVKKRTNGGLTIEVFHSAQLGVEEDIIEQLGHGANIGQNTDAARLGHYVPGIAAVNAPYFVTSLDQAFALAGSPTMIAWQKELADKHGVKTVCFDWVQGFRHFFTSKPVRKPEDLSGLRIRTPPARIWQESIRALGAVPVSMNFGDVYPGLQQQLIDGAELTYPNIRNGKLYEVLKYANETGHILLINFEVVSAQWFNSLPPAYQTALVEECRKAGQETSKIIQEATDQAKAEVAKLGMTIVSDVDMAAFHRAGEKAYEKLNLTQARAKVQKEISQMGHSVGDR